jgi:DNA-binding CsgD family transcriptional regulator/tetratricopeptide (TPR) repeat protein
VRGDAVRADLVEAVHGALADLGRRGLVLVVVEDVHWADESTRELLTLLFTRGGPDGVGLLATWRSDDIHRRHPLASALAVWSRLPALTRLDLGPLPDADLRRIVRRVGAELPPRVVEEIARRAEGNAFFAEELAVAARDGGPDLADLTRLLLTRVDQLDDGAQSVVRVAAIIGRRVPHELLVRVSGVEPSTLRTALRAAVEHHVLEPCGEEGYEFRHALLAEAVTDDLLPAERLQLHRACAEALLQDPSLGSTADLARHALASGDRAVALDASVRAGDAAQRMGGPAEALAHYETALALAEADHARVHDLTLRAASAANGSGRTMRAMALLRAALASDAPTDHERAELLGALAFAARLTEEQVDRLALTQEALGLLADDAPVQLRVYLLARRAEALMDGGAPAQALVVADEAMALAVEHDLTVDRTDLTSILARLSESAGDPGESIRRLEVAVAAWTSAPDLALLRAMHILASVHYRQGDHLAALAAFERTLVEARRAGLEWSVFGVDARAMAVTTAYEMGEWDLALRLADHSTDAGMPSGAAASIDAAALGVLAGRGGCTADDLLAGTRPWWSEEGRIAVQSGAAAVDVLGRDGDVDAMLALHGEVVGFLRGLWGAGCVAAEVRLGALAVGHLGSALRGAAPARRAELLDHVDRLSAQAAAVWGGGLALPPDAESPSWHVRASVGGALLLPPTVEGRAWQARATAEQLRAHWLAGDDVPLADLVDASRRVVDLFVEQGETYEVARARTRLAEVLLAAGDPAADALVAAAREAAQRLGAAPLLAVLGHLVPRHTPRAAPSILTAREAEVLGLLAQGRSNGEVGRALFISTKTASVHVSNILAKLGAASRGEAVALARASGLLDD